MEAQGVGAVKTPCRQPGTSLNTAEISSIRSSSLSLLLPRGIRPAQGLPSSPQDTPAPSPPTAAETPPPGRLVTPVWCRWLLPKGILDLTLTSHCPWSRAPGMGQGGCLSCYSSCLGTPGLSPQHCCASTSVPKESRRRASETGSKRGLWELPAVSRSHTEGPASRIQLCMEGKDAKIHPILSSLSHTDLLGHARGRGPPLFLTLNLIISHILSLPSTPGPTPTATSLPTISTLLGVSRNPEHPDTEKSSSCGCHVWPKSSGKRDRVSQQICGNVASCWHSQDLGQVAGNTRKRVSPGSAVHTASGHGPQREPGGTVLPFLSETAHSRVSTPLCKSCPGSSQRLSLDSPWTPG